MVCLLHVIDTSADCWVQELDSNLNRLKAVAPKDTKCVVIVNDSFLRTHHNIITTARATISGIFIYRVYFFYIL